MLVNFLVNIYFNKKGKQHQLSLTMILKKTNLNVVKKITSLSLITIAEKYDTYAFGMIILESYRGSILKG